ncbi:MAG: hypothetical protein Q7T50_01125, partial [Candidatus Magasanikbacteria bacterium]|nr:hypothetical protein [Candidatus Magasanikbacteria bacterium]
MMYALLKNHKRLFGQPIPKKPDCSNVLVAALGILLFSMNAGFATCDCNTVMPTRHLFNFINCPLEPYYLKDETTVEYEQS